MDIQHTYYTVAFIILTIMTHLHRLQIEPTHSTRSHRLSLFLQISVDEI